MYVDNGGDQVVGHLVEGLVPQDACIVDHDVNPSEGVDGSLDDGFAALGAGHTVAVGHGLTAEGLDLGHHLLGRRCRTVASSIDGTSEVVDHHPGSPAGEFQGVLPPQATSGAGDDGHLAVESEISHRLPFPRSRLSRRALVALLVCRPVKSATRGR